MFVIQSLQESIISSFRMDINPFYSVFIGIPRDPCPSVHNGFGRMVLLCVSPSLHASIIAGFIIDIKLFQPNFIHSFILQINFEDYTKTKLLYNKIKWNIFWYTWQYCSGQICPLPIQLSFFLDTYRIKSIYSNIT